MSIPRSTEVENGARTAEANLSDNSAEAEKRSTGPDNPSPPPNGGLVAWLQVLASFMVFFNTWGVLNTFGNFQTYYESGQLFVQSSANISWVGSIQAYCVLLFGLFAGPIYDRGHLRWLLLVGSFLIVFGFMMLSLSKTYWQVLLSQGFCIGIGAGLLFTPAVAVLPAYFSSRLGLAMGLAATGSSLGGIIYPIMLYRLIENDGVGFGWGVRAIGFVSLGTLLVPIFLLKMRFKPQRPRALIDWSAFTDWPFAFLVVSVMFGFGALYAMLFYFSYFGLARGISSPSMSFYLVPILNAASVFGRSIPNAMSDVVGPLNLFGPAALVCAVLTFSMLGVTNLAGLIVVAILFGFFSGVFIALPPVIMVQLTADKSKIGTRIGMGMAFFGFGTLLGGPGSGAILGTDRNDLHFDHVWIYGGVMSITTAVLMCILRMWLAKGKLYVKV